MSNFTSLTTEKEGDREEERWRKTERERERERERNRDIASVNARTNIEVVRVCSI